MDEEKTQVFVYDNIFYSRAVDTKDNFKVSTPPTVLPCSKLLIVALLT